MANEVEEEWGKLKARIETIFEQYEDQQIRLPLSFGVKSLVLLFATLEISTNFKAIHLETNRHSPTVQLHNLSLISMLEDLSIVVDVVHIPCGKTVLDQGLTGCPVMLYLKDIPPDIQDILASIGKVYKNPKINEKKDKFYKHKDRHFPMRFLSLDMISEMYRIFVPYLYKFPVNSITSCNMPICPTAYDEYPPFIFSKYTDWTLE